MTGSWGRAARTPAGTTSRCTTKTTAKVKQTVSPVVIVSWAWSVSVSREPQPACLSFRSPHVSTDTPPSGEPVHSGALAAVAERQRGECGQLAAGRHQGQAPPPGAIRRP